MVRVSRAGAVLGAKPPPPMSPVEAVRTAVSLFARDRIRSIRLATQSVQGDPAGPYAFQILARAAEAVDKNEIRDHLVWASAALAPGMRDILPLVGETLERRGELERAMSIYWRGLVLQPGDTALRIRLGKALAKTDEKSAAAMVFRQVLLLDPGQRDADNLLEQMPNARLAVAEEGLRKYAEFDQPEAPITSARDPNRIAILCPTRARPARIRQLCRSVQETVRMLELIDVWLYVDDDDQVTLDALEDGTLEDMGVTIRVEVGPRLPTLAAMYNRLWQRASAETGAGLAVAFIDDAWFVTRGWDDLIRLTYAAHADRLLLAHLPDPVSGSDDVTLFCLSHEWIETVGYVMAEWFPFWFTDMWNDQIAQMVQRKRTLDVKLDADNKGKTHRLRDLQFWWQFFSAMASDREEAAERLRRHIFAQDPESYFASRTLGWDYARVFRSQAEKLPEDLLSAMEQAFTEEKSDPGPEYLEAKKTAEAELTRRAQQSEALDPKKGRA